MKRPVLRRAEDSPLETENRRRVFLYVQENPGLHMGELERRLDLAPGTLAYHLQYLEEVGLVEPKQESYYKRYYARGDVGRVERETLRLLRQQVPRHIVAELLLSTGLPHKEIASRFELAPSTVSYHLDKLVKAGLARKEGEGKAALYKLADPDALARALLTYRASFLDSLVDRVLETWLEAHP